MPTGDRLFLRVWRRLHSLGLVPSIHSFQARAWRTLFCLTAPGRLSFDTSSLRAVSISWVLTLNNIQLRQAGLTLTPDRSRLHRHSCRWPLRGQPLLLECLVFLLVLLLLLFLMVQPRACAEICLEGYDFRNRWFRSLLTTFEPSLLWLWNRPCPLCGS